MKIEQYQAKTGIALGIDIGGTGIKGAPVNLATGELKTERYRIDTPQPSKPQAVVEVVKEIIAHFDWQGPIGITLPAPIQKGVVKFMANMDTSWDGVNAETLFSEALKQPVMVLNDADAAGLAEVVYGVGRAYKGTLILLTLGTGIGSAVFVNGQLVPNTEFGHLEIRGKDAEQRASDRVRQEKDLSWRKWAKRLNEFFERIEKLFSPDLLVIGGGVSREAGEFLKYVKTDAKIVPAKLLNNAGIVGAAWAASSLVKAGE